MNTKDLVLIFTRNPELGKCKTRLATTIGDQAALDVYKILLTHTVSVTENLSCAKEVYYSAKIKQDDVWNPKRYTKKLQSGTDLGERIKNAFAEGFMLGYENIIIIGSDLYDLNQQDIELAFKHLKTHDCVIGPAEDGGYYLLGIKTLYPKLFENKSWGTATVLQDTLHDLKQQKVKLLEQRNDIDQYEDIKDIPIFQQFYKLTTND